MKLVHRVSVFFLAALAAVLVIYSGMFYGFARSRLIWQSEHELHGALNALVASIEVEPEEVKWQPLEHTVALGQAGEFEDLLWIVIGDRSRVVARSHSMEADFEKLALANARETDGDRDHSLGDRWFWIQNRLEAPQPVRTEREADEFDELLVVVARRAETLNAALTQLLTLVCVLPIVVWLVFAAVGRWFCRQALQPVLEMARQAGAMSGTRFDARLPVSLTRDELSDLAEAFNTLLDRQEEAFDVQRRFAGDAAHELRTPLTVLRGQLDVALRRPRSVDEYQETLRLLGAQTQELQSLVESLLFLARMEKNAPLPDRETIDLCEWIKDYSDRWRDHPRRQDLACATGEPECLVVVSRPLLTRLIDNLVENAFKFSTDGSPVWLRLTGAESEAILAVEDRGMGLAIADQQAVFQPFFRARPAQDAGIAGTGLGLAIAARIAAALGGRLVCRSQPDQGSVFEFRLPRAVSPGRTQSR